MTTNIEDEQWEEPFHRANELLVRHRHHDACEVLQAAKNVAVAANDLHHAAFYASVLGSFLASEGHRDAALKEYEDAERYEPDQAAHTLRTARLLLEELAAEAALGKIERVITALKTDEGEIKEAREIVLRVIEIVDRQHFASVAVRARRLQQQLE